jgi:hypothetical protein
VNRSQALGIIPSYAQLLTHHGRAYARGMSAFAVSEQREVDGTSYVPVVPAGAIGSCRSSASSRLHESVTEGDNKKTGAS